MHAVILCSPRSLLVVFVSLAVLASALYGNSLIPVARKLHEMIYKFIVTCKRSFCSVSNEYVGNFSDSGRQAEALCFFSVV